jgi:hypothetical protein
MAELQRKMPVSSLAMQAFYDKGFVSARTLKVKKELPAATCPRPKGKGLAHITQFF